MPMMTIPAKDGGQFQAYVAMPAVLPAPTVIVIQEIFGITPELRTKCDMLAARGFIAVCPDLFWRLEPGVVLEPRDPAELKKAYELMGRFDVDQGIWDLRAASHTFKGHAQSTGLVGCVGYCMGGKMAYLMACRSHIDCAIGYYGGGIDRLLDEQTGIKKPVLLHFAEEDKHIPREAQAAIKAELQDNPLITIHTYPGVDHAFTRLGGENYNEAAAQLANSRTLDFLRKILKSEV